MSLYYGDEEDESPKADEKKRPAAQLIPRSTAEFVHEHPFISAAILCILGVILIGSICAAEEIINPTEIVNQTITISERYGGHVVTSENKWYEVTCLNSCIRKLQPGHAYEVQIRRPLSKGIAIQTGYRSDEIIVGINRMVN